MKITALLLVAATLATPAFAAPHSAKKLSKTRPGANWLINDYMNCKQVKKTALEKQRADMTCDEKSSLHFCSILEPLPKDVQNNIALELYCNFLAGEHPENSAQDVDITKAAEKAGCFEGGDVRATLNEKYKDNTDALDALENFTGAFFDAEDNCYKPDSAPAPAAADDEAAH